MKLYGYWRSSSSYRVRIALELKGLVFEYVPIDLTSRGGVQHSREFNELSPLAQVPVLEVEENSKHFTITQSVAIIEYLEERFGEPLLLPEEPGERARAREFAQIINSGIQPFHNSGFLDELRAHSPKRDPLLMARHYLEKGLRALELLSLPVARRFALGDSVTLADVFLIPQLYQARRFGVDLSAYPTLLRVERHCQELPAFQRAHPDAQPDAVPQSSSSADGERPNP